MHGSSATSLIIECVGILRAVIWKEERRLNKKNKKLRETNHMGLICMTNEKMKEKRVVDRNLCFDGDLSLIKDDEHKVSRLESSSEPGVILIIECVGILRAVIWKEERRLNKKNKKLRETNHMGLICMSE
ncbi:hypothetical protein L2E82_48713 [Cichorium intybus]|uniref:Uncharacterized protein n=1 Tax=Cichorium intybus TaxID=13427 RepID=A0ACB8YYW3_CICIN|nr:hypothetical protein L2E82_48713 [Cichorium intybus]